MFTVHLMKNKLVMVERNEDDGAMTNGDNDRGDHSVCNSFKCRQAHSFKAVKAAKTTNYDN